MIEQIIRDREEHGTFRDLKDFLERLSGKEVNKRAVENFIKSGAFDSLKGTRKQFMIIYVQIMDQVAQNKKNSLAGQMSLFDIVDDEQKKEFEVTLPDVGEYQKETMLAFEKEVLGVYISGHPLEEYEEKWRKSISATTLDFQLDEETGRTKVRVKGDHRWYDHIEDDQIYKEESNDGIYYRRGSSWNGRGCHFPAEL